MELMHIATQAVSEQPASGGFDTLFVALLGGSLGALITAGLGLLTNRQNNKAQLEREHQVHQFELERRALSLKQEQVKQLHDKKILAYEKFIEAGMYVCTHSLASVREEHNTDQVWRSIHHLLEPNFSAIVPENIASGHRSLHFTIKLYQQVVLDEHGEYFRGGQTDAIESAYDRFCNEFHDLANLMRQDIGVEPHSKPITLTVLDRD